MVVFPDMIRVLLADDHTLMREGLKHILQNAPDIEICAEATDGFETVQLVRKTPFDVLVMDLSMPGRCGMELIRQIKDEVPKLAILVLTMHEEDEYAARTIRAGAMGYMTKEGAGAQLVNAIRRVASGRPYISMEVAEQLAIEAMPTHEKLPHKSLSDREFEVFNLLVNGKTAMAEVHPNDVHPGLDESLDTVVARGCWPQCCHNLRASHSVPTLLLHG